MFTSTWQIKAIIRLKYKTYVLIYQESGFELFGKFDICYHLLQIYFKLIWKYNTASNLKDPHNQEKIFTILSHPSSGMACNLSDSELDKVLLGYIHSRKLLSFVIVTVREKTFYTNWFSSRLSLLCRRRFCYWRFFDSIVPFQNNRCNEKKTPEMLGKKFLYFSCL